MNLLVYFKPSYLIKYTAALSVLLCWGVMYLCMSPTVQAQATNINTKTDSVFQQIALKKSFKLSEGKQVFIFLQTPADVEITATNENQVSVQIDMSGNYLVADARLENGLVIVSTVFSRPESFSSASGVIRVQVPKNAEINLQGINTQLSVSDLVGKVSATIQMGTITATNLSAEAILSTDNGYVYLLGGKINGQVRTGQGGVYVKGVKGNFGASHPVGDFMVDSPSQIVDAKLENDSLHIEMQQGNLYSRAFRGKMYVSWKGNAIDIGNQLDLSGIESEITLALPEGVGAELDVEQVQTDGSNPIAIDSEYGSLDEVEKKDLLHQNKKNRLERRKKTLSGGRNQVKLHGYDSKLHLKKA